MVDVLTRRITRDQIAPIAGGNPRATRYLEDIGRDVTESLPDGIDAALRAAASANSSAQAARVVADGAMEEAEEAHADAFTALAETRQTRRDLSDTGDVADLVHGLMAQVCDLRESLAAAVARIESLECKP